MSVEMLEANSPHLKSFIEVSAEHDFPIQNLPFGVFQLPEQQGRVGVAIGDYVVDLTVLVTAGLLDMPVEWFNQPYLNNLLAQPHTAWRKVRNAVSLLLRHDNAALREDKALCKKALHAQADVTMLLPAKITGYTDFYSSKEHATNLGKMFRPGGDPLMPNWLHMPIAYDGRASSVVVSGTDFPRPHGQLKLDPEAPSTYGPSQRMDMELEVAFMLGDATSLGDTVPVNEAHQHIFGVMVLNDWSARDIQKWEYQPLGPFLGKNFCTTVSPWVVTLDALQAFRVEGPKQEPTPLPYLQNKEPWQLNLELEVALKTPSLDTPHVITRTNFRHIYWNQSQQLAHHTMNGCNIQPGDIFASGTVSGAEPDSVGSLLELTWAGKNPIELPNGEKRVFLQDHDTLIMRGWAQGKGYRIGFGDVVGTVLPAKTLETESSHKAPAKMA